MNNYTIRDFARFDTFRKIIESCRIEHQSVDEIFKTVDYVSPANLALYLRYLHYLGHLEKEVRPHGRFRNPKHYYKSVSTISNDEAMQAISLKQFKLIKFFGENTIVLPKEQEHKTGTPRVITIESLASKIVE